MLGHFGDVHWFRDRATVMSSSIGFAGFVSSTVARANCTNFCLSSGSGLLSAPRLSTAIAEAKNCTADAA